ncbi:MAG: Rieske 2Fe-2S domain-containing protein [Gammaproteobacteria bacterium]
MSHDYQAVGWNRQKKIYDLTILVGLIVFFAAWFALHFVLHPEVTAEALIIRGFAVAAFFLLHVILSIGPLCRIDSRFLPLLYNRRHLGVTMFLLAAVHGVFSLIQFHALGDVNPLVSLLTSNGNVSDISEFPFQPFGFAALLILFLMAATSHDFWLANLSAPVWKALHMCVYVAYVLLLAHVAFGILQSETDASLGAIVALGAIWVIGLHLFAATVETRRDKQLVGELSGDWVDAGPAQNIPNGRARVVQVAGERVAIFHYDGLVSAVSAVCQHQNGPLGEGCVIDGLITCPWHGYQYDPRTGRSPAPFNERIPTFALRLVDNRLQVNAQPQPAGTDIEPLTLPEATHA